MEREVENVTVVLELLLGALAAFGLVCLWWLIFGSAVLPAGAQESGFAVIPARGDGVALDQTVQGLLFLRRNDLYRGSIVILDDGLDDRGRAMARLLCANTAGLLLCSREELAKVICKEYERDHHGTDPIPKTE